MNWCLLGVRPFWVRGSIFWEKNCVFRTFAISLEPLEVKCSYLNSRQVKGFGKWTKNAGFGPKIEPHLTQNWPDALKAPVHPRIYLGIRYGHLTPSASRDIANVPKTQFFAPKMEPPNPKWMKPPKGTCSSQDLLWVKIWALSSKWFKRYEKYTKNVFFCPKIKSGWLFLLRVYFILSTCRVLKYQVPNPNSNRDIATWTFGVKNSVFVP